MTCRFTQEIAPNSAAADYSVAPKTFTRAGFGHGSGLRLRFAALLGLALFSLSACTSRTLVITTEPPGARVFIDNLEVGTTPLELDFVHGAKREFLLLKDERGGPEGGPFRPLLVQQDLENFWYDTFPFDVFTELTPLGGEERFEFHFVLEPATTLANFQADPETYGEALIERAAAMRRRADDALEEGFPTLLDDGDGATDESADSPARDDEAPGKSDDDQGRVDGESRDSGLDFPPERNDAEEAIQSATTKPQSQPNPR